MYTNYLGTKKPAPEGAGLFANRLDYIQLYMTLRSITVTVP